MRERDRFVMPHDSLRAAGQVVRWHTWPMRDRGTVATHSWGVARIHYILWPDSPAHCLASCLFHDTGEQRSGDMPLSSHPARPAAKRALDRIEQDSLTNLLGTMNPTTMMTPHQRLRVKACDLLEMLEHTRHEIAWGNPHMQLSLDVLNDTLSRTAHSLLEIDPKDYVLVTTAQDMVRSLGEVTVAIHDWHEVLRDNAAEAQRLIDEGAVHA